MFSHLPKMTGVLQIFLNISDTYNSFYYLFLHSTSPQIKKVLAFFVGKLLLYRQKVKVILKIIVNIQSLHSGKTGLNYTCNLNGDFFFLSLTDPQLYKSASQPLPLLLPQGSVHLEQTWHLHQLWSAVWERETFPECRWIWGINMMKLQRSLMIICWIKQTNCCSLYIHVGPCLFFVKQCMVKLKVENTGSETLYFTYYTPLHWLKYFQLIDDHKVTRTNPLCLKPGDVTISKPYLLCWKKIYGHNVQ